VRQISNPMAGVDTTLLALAGTGYLQRRAFGFMSCERVVGAAEGMNVLQEKRVWKEDGQVGSAAARRDSRRQSRRGARPRRPPAPHSHSHSPPPANPRPPPPPPKTPKNQGGGSWAYEYAITNVEYTEFERLGIEDVAVEGSNHSVFPANTNILYVGLDAARAQVEAAVAAGGGDVLPGLIFNMKKKVHSGGGSGGEGGEGLRKRPLGTRSIAGAATHPSPQTPTCAQVNYYDAFMGVDRAVYAGRMECTMQNLADALVTTSDQPLTSGAEARNNGGAADGGAGGVLGGAGGGAGGLAERLSTFLVYNMRRKVRHCMRRAA
jgi:hypothetical protein